LNEPPAIVDNAAEILFVHPPTILDSLTALIVFVLPPTIVPKLLLVIVLQHPPPKKLNSPFALF
jgi:hypothetical protein